MGSGDEGAEFGVSGVSEFMGKELLILAQGDCVYLSPRVNFNSHGLHAILCGKHQVSVEGYLTI